MLTTEETLVCERNFMKLMGCKPFEAKFELYNHQQLHTTEIRIDSTNVRQSIHYKIITFIKPKLLLSHVNHIFGITKYTFFY